MKIILKIFVVFVSITFLCSGAFAAEKKGKLDSFEESIDEPQTREESHDDDHHHHRHYEESHTVESSVTGGVMSLITDFFLAGLVAGGAASYSDMRQELKTTESPALPTLRIEPSYQYVFDGIHGFAGNIEAGWLMFGADGEFLYYWETASNDNLKIGGGHFLFRTLFSRLFQTNLAMGVRTFQGNTGHTGFDLGLPFYIFFGKHFIWDIKPYITFLQGRDIYDISSGLSFKYKFFGIRAAYRAINVSHETIHGPQVGVFIQF